MFGVTAVTAINIRNYLIRVIAFTLLLWLRA